MRLKFLFPILAAGFATLAGLPAAGQGKGLFTPVITVNDAVITRYELEQRMKFLTILQFPGDIEAEAETGLIEDRLRQQGAKAVGAGVSDEEIQAGMAEFAGRANLDTEQFLAAIAEGGVEPEAFRDFVSSGMAWRNAVRTRYVGKLTATDAEVDRALSSDSGRGDGPRVLLSEIYLPARQGEIGVKTEIARRLKEGLHGEADFARAARENSVATSRDGGGKVEWIPVTNLPPQVRQAVSSTSQGQVTEPVVLPGYVALYLVRGMSEGGKITPTDIVVDFAEVHLPAGSEAELQRIANAAATCDQLYTEARGLPEGQLQRQKLRRSQIGGATGAALDLLDADETTILRGSNGTLTLVKLCSRNATLPSGPIAADMPIEYSVPARLTAEGDVIPSPIKDVGLGSGVSRDEVRESVLNRKLAQYADLWLAQLKADAIINRP